ncbi:hypothetical protein MLD63_15405 [Paracoccus sp. TK19116]|uniref:Uncharacterized protein n=1 Tax=Paracoccus albicereus TaxID=2922394 RepID=A0ABT1MWV3_9RHOB|nr:hypothetical protein [Paracoccus albicereus]MCQ0971808.1 hypothetical protein [Paracoccus albicereus]
MAMFEQLETVSDVRVRQSEPAQIDAALVEGGTLAKETRYDSIDLDAVDDFIFL